MRTFIERKQIISVLPFSSVSNHELLKIVPRDSVNQSLRNENSKLLETINKQTTIISNCSKTIESHETTIKEYETRVAQLQQELATLKTQTNHVPIHQDLQEILNELRMVSIHKEHWMNITEAQCEESHNNWMEKCSLEKKVERLSDENKMLLSETKRLKDQLQQIEYERNQFEVCNRPTNFLRGRRQFRSKRH